MTGKTHRAGGMLLSILGFAFLRYNGLLHPQINPALQWLMMYPFCIWGSIASDLDHHWEICPSKDIPSWFICKLLHITDPIYKPMKKSMTESQQKKSKLFQVVSFFNAKHRSWQTHSDLTFIAMLLLLKAVMEGKFMFLNTYDMAVLYLMITGVATGVMAHFILDMLTPQGVWCTPMVFINRVLLKGKLNKKWEKWRFVPKLSCFATGSSWEDFVHKTLKVFTVIGTIWLVLTLFIPNVWTKVFELTEYVFPYTISFSMH